MTIADLWAGVPDDGVMGPRSQQPKRRTFTAEYKLAVVAEYDAATEPGAKGALLRREGCTRRTSLSGDGPGMLVRWLGWPTSRVSQHVATLTGRRSGCPLCQG
jgi:hypothetical protein